MHDQRAKLCLCGNANGGEWAKEGEKKGGKQRLFSLELPREVSWRQPWVPVQLLPLSGGGQRVRDKAPCDAELSADDDDQAQVLISIMLSETERDGEWKKRTTDRCAELCSPTELGCGLSAGLRLTESFKSAETRKRGNHVENRKTIPNTHFHPRSSVNMPPGGKVSGRPHLTLSECCSARKAPTNPEPKHNVPFNLREKMAQYRELQGPVFQHCSDFTFASETGDAGRECKEKTKQRRTEGSPVNHKCPVQFRKFVMFGRTGLSGMSREIQTDRREESSSSTGALEQGDWHSGTEGERERGGEGEGEVVQWRRRRGGDVLGVVVHECVALRELIVTLTLPASIVCIRGGAPTLNVTPAESRPCREQRAPLPSTCPLLSLYIPGQ
ncbi:hypothetical protein EXN66_Car002010 [Channa argus]|uniref:Uncharacterized protein n=1 Tax=Channa argus TaxID=215402 RepID=A0A6G1P8G0_CHAAH|nr:hypothetical protein EXN66_Car002010 [Channa argus]